MPGSEYQGLAPWAVFVAIALSAALSWAAQAWLYRHKRADEKAVRKTEHDDRLEIHRDELTFELLQNARLEMASARIEVEDLREEVRKLRSMENHFYYFQQSLDHLEALLFPESEEAREVAERNARAFLTRMRRLNEAKGTISNEAQRAASTVHLLGDDPVVNSKPKKD
jgi:hypothetical protein